MKLFEEFKLYETMWDNDTSNSISLNKIYESSGSDPETSSIIELGKTPIDFNIVKNIAQLEEIFNLYYEDTDNNLSYNEYITQFIPKLLNNKSVPLWAKQLFKSSTDVNNIAFAGGDETDDVVAACYNAIEECGYNSDDYGMDDIGEFIADQAVYGFFIKNNTLYVYISCSEQDLETDFVNEYIS